MPATPKLLAAYTPPGSSFPAYINLSQVDDVVEVTVRGPVKPNGHSGDVATMRIDVPALRVILQKSLANLS